MAAPTDPAPILCPSAPFISPSLLPESDLLSGVCALSIPDVIVVCVWLVRFRDVLKDIPLPPPSSVDLKQALKDAQREAIVLNGKIFKVRHSALTFTRHTQKGAAEHPVPGFTPRINVHFPPKTNMLQPLIPPPSTVPDPRAASCVCWHVRATPRVWRRR